MYFSDTGLMPVSESYNYESIYIMGFFLPSVITAPNVWPSAPVQQPEPYAPVMEAPPEVPDSVIIPVDYPDNNRGQMIEKYRDAPRYNGEVVINGTRFKIRYGELGYRGTPYLVSKDGRAVISRELLLVGEIKNGVMIEPTPEFIKEFSLLGRVI